MPRYPRTRGCCYLADTIAQLRSRFILSLDSLSVTYRLHHILTIRSLKESALYLYHQLYHSYSCQFCLEIGDVSVTLSHVG